MDERVQEVQYWLVDTYPTYFASGGSFPIATDGITGGNTVKALVMALQIHLKLSPVDGVWGNGTSSACPTISQSTTDSVLLRILQAGCICKGYNPGPIDGIWGNNTANAIVKFKEDLGFTNAAATLSPAYFKSLLTTDPTILTPEPPDDLLFIDRYYRKRRVRMVQQYLNANYSSLFVANLGYIPTGGDYERKTSKALIYAFQSVIGTTADGVLGPNTFAQMPAVRKGSQLADVVKILQCALICNKSKIEEIDGVYDDELVENVVEFQKFMRLEIDHAVILGEVNRRTWGALLRSCGDTARVPNAADTRFQLTATQAQSLYDDGYMFIGRYLTKVPGGFDKNLTDQEIINITDADLHIVPIFQENNSGIESFSGITGYASWCKAVYAATRLRLPECTIYFAVDFDATEAQTNGAVKNFFQGIKDARSVNPSIYNVGIYSSRNTCDVMLSNKLAENCYVSNMSTGYSGNLGFLMPENWSFDQYATGRYKASDNSTIDLDKVIASGNDDGVIYVPDIGLDNWNLHVHKLIDTNIDQYINNAEPVLNIIPYITELEDAYWEYRAEKDGDVDVNADTAEECVLSVLYYLWHKKYDETFKAILAKDDEFCNHVDEKVPELAESLDQYIAEGNVVILKDDSAAADAYKGLFELHHLSAVISAYLRIKEYLFVKAKPEWFGWAGDMATAFDEIITLKSNLKENYVSDIDHARDRVCRMEVDSVVDPVQMNYCDLFGDADGFAIYTVIKDLLKHHKNKEHILSNAFDIYYGSSTGDSSRAHYTKRICYLLNNLPIKSCSIDDISTMLKNYFLDISQTLLIIQFAKANLKNQDHKDIIEACCIAFTEFFMHYF